MKRIFVLTMILFAGWSVAFAQEKKLVREGNKLYTEQKYKEATEAYKQAALKNPNYTPSVFNLGNALYKQKEYDSARMVMSAAAKMADNKQTAANANYNIGNTYMEEKKWEEAIEAYKEALRKNPQDADAKYNLSYAKEMLKKEGGGGKDKNKDKNKDEKDKDKQGQNNKDKDEQDKENKDGDNKDRQDKKDEQKDKQNQNGKDGKDKKDEQEKRPQGQPSKLSEQQAEQLLKALENEEKKLQDKLKKGEGVPVKVDKDW